MELESYSRGYATLTITQIITDSCQKQLEDKLRKLDAFITLTEEDRDECRKVLIDSWVGPNPLASCPKAHAACETQKRIAVGKYTYEKGFDQLIDIW